VVPVVNGTAVAAELAAKRGQTVKMDLMATEVIMAAELVVLINNKMVGRVQFE
jgi:hypothetical protein